MTLEERQAGFLADYQALAQKWGLQWGAETKLNYKEYGTALMVEPITQAKLIPIDGWQETTAISVPQNGRELSAGSQELQSEKA